VNTQLGADYLKVDLRVPSKGPESMCVKTYCADRNAPEQPALALPAGVPDTQTGKSLQPKGSLVFTLVATCSGLDCLDLT
jgi:hypothetical protein